MIKVDLRVIVNTVILTIIAIAGDWFLFPTIGGNVDFSEKTSYAPLNLKSRATTSEANELLLSSFVSMNPNHIAKTESKSNLLDDIKPVEPILSQGEIQLSSLAIRLSAIFERGGDKSAIVEVRNIESKDIERLVLTSDSSIGDYKVNNITFDRVTLVNEQLHQVEFILFKQQTPNE